ncbi:hypothetical protein BDK51DRAFT_51232 [Blyttiomyces helicus]|uniref:Extracellular membrane protein CFEM domain-containing protein n=1 Tax=Blyttiomyces helicus TaxID=388810 RepID=A0A4P9W273_9FUNG|nr:hypothetical protein BDK51DRAFT_51232 [Blyttiomyces helicus]|eukprot:RKO84166.1 hypothetical protein BDK51DRAFT_51232 [Blyttiomyces helicus]
MHVTLSSLLLLAASALAQISPAVPVFPSLIPSGPSVTTTTSVPAVPVASPSPATVSGCAASADFTNCLSNQNALLAACAATDLKCPCTVQQNLYFCYQNFCPSSPNIVSASCTR